MTPRSAYQDFFLNLPLAYQEEPGPRMFLFVYLTDIFRALDEVCRIDNKWNETNGILLWKRRLVQVEK